MTKLHSKGNKSVYLHINNILQSARYWVNVTWNTVRLGRRFDKAWYLWEKWNKNEKRRTKTYGCFAGTHIDYNLSRQLLQYFVPIVEQGISHIFKTNEVFDLNMQISSFLKYYKFTIYTNSIINKVLSLFENIT